MNKFDLIVAGDNATDAFIRLAEAELNCEIDKPECKICMKFAAKIPYESVEEIPAGGNSSNVALGARKLGLSVAYISNIGDDYHGEKILEKLEKAEINTEWVKKNIGYATNYNYVLWYADDRTILVKHENYPNFWPDNLPEANWFYLSSLSDPDQTLHKKIIAWLEKNPQTKLVFSPGTWQLRMGVEKLKQIYNRAEIIFSNKQEALIIADLDNNSKTKLDDNHRSLAEKIKELGPKTVVITDGERGAFVLDSENNFYQIPIFTAFGSAKERTGAGDAFASAYLTAVALGLNSEQALSWGATNSASVVTHIGPHAGLLTRQELEEKLKPIENKD